MFFCFFVFLFFLSFLNSIALCWTRLRIAEFIVILISQILPSANRGFGPAGEGPKPVWMTKWAQQELVELLGEESSAVVDDIIDAGRQRFSDQEGQQTAMLGYAQQLLHLASSF
jgi:hypothetical protein